MFLTALLSTRQEWNLRSGTSPPVQAKWERWRDGWSKHPAGTGHCAVSRGPHVGLCVFPYYCSRENSKALDKHLLTRSASLYYPYWNTVCSMKCGMMGHHHDITVLCLFCSEGHTALLWPFMGTSRVSSLKEGGFLVWTSAEPLKQSIEHMLFKHFSVTVVSEEHLLWNSQRTRIGWAKRNFTLPMKWTIHFYNG